MNSEEQAEKAGFTTLEEDRKARLLAYEKQLKRFQRLHENAEELLAALRHLLDRAEASSDFTYDSRNQYCIQRANLVIRKIEGD